jgi:hypothetical protein
MLGFSSCWAKDNSAGRSGRVVATFSNRLAAEKFAEQQQARDESARNHPTDGVSR